MNEKIKKVIAWRILSLICGWIISYFYIGTVLKSLELTVVIGITMTIIHYFFESWWENAGRGSFNK
tara:strand:+ start:335 stop:532 length:198 start_codon:yes stop_codon:yes gene_type:complete